MSDDRPLVPTRADRPLAILKFIPGLPLFRLPYGLLDLAVHPLLRNLDSAPPVSKLPQT